ncbi:MAG: PilN domain-containing protein [Clostridia bacterium]|nr:PilN domain-containing protein [Clostridia bacterium]
MEACLGIYLGDKIIKYAKLIRDDKSKRISLHSCGTKYVVGNKEVSIAEIISQTGSADDSLCLNLTDYSRMQTEVLRQLGKADTQSVIDLEVSDYATSRALNEKTLEYRYIFMDSSVSIDNHTAEIVITDKANISKLVENEKYSNLIGLYPQEYILPNMVQSNSNYLLVNIDEKTQVISVVGGKIKQIIDIDVSMKNILDNIAAQEGSYSKACDLCKNINVLSDDSLSPDLERIIEPTIQDLLNRIKSKLEDSKISYEKIYLNGLINLFINIDVLFEQFFGISTEKIRPYFVNLDEVANIPEVIEATDAISLAYEGLEGFKPEANFVTNKNMKASLGGLFAKDKSGKKQKTPGGKKTVAVLPNINLEKIEKSLLFANLTAGAVLLGYVGFSAAYDAELTKMENTLTENINKLQEETATIKADKSYIDQNTNQYTTFNNYISETVQKIREGTIGKYTTYNVANFMQKIAKYIPTNVQIETISSNDNKTVSIVAKSTSYAELGYFISQLKLQGVLENIQTSNVSNGTTISVTIGGDLP